MVRVAERETKEQEARSAVIRPPLVSVRLAAALALLAGLLILAHGCHGPDEDHELFTRGMLRRVALHGDAPGVVPFSARAALAVNGNGSPRGSIHSTPDVHSSRSRD
jgi:hypothetical protein